jgi:hypothetical protein
VVQRQVKQITPYTTILRAARNGPQRMKRSLNRFNTYIERLGYSRLSSMHIYHLKLTTHAIFPSTPNTSNSYNNPLIFKQQSHLNRFRSEVNLKSSQKYYAVANIVDVEFLHVTTDLIQMNVPIHQITNSTPPFIRKATSSSLPPITPLLPNRAPTSSPSHLTRPPTIHAKHHPHITFRSFACSVHAKEKSCL